MPIVITDDDPVSRGAHQSEEFPGMLPHWRVDQAARWRSHAIEIASAPATDMTAAR